MSQIAELSQVEQLQSVSSASQMGEAAGLIGKTVTADDASGTTITGVVTGVTNGTSGPLLDVGNTTVALSDVQQIGEAAPRADQTPHTPTTALSRFRRPGPRPHRSRLTTTKRSNP